MTQDIREQVRARYAAAAVQGAGDEGCCAGGGCGPADIVVDARFGASL